MIPSTVVALRATQGTWKGKVMTISIEPGPAGSSFPTIYFDGTGPNGPATVWINVGTEGMSDNLQTHIVIVATVALQAGTGTVMINVNDMGQTDNIVWATD
jgi:hypothetical protein